jgi:hypothetical protein
MTKNVILTWPGRAKAYGLDALCLLFVPPSGLCLRYGKILTSAFVSSNSENISCTTFMKYKTAENRELTLWHLVNRLVPENV